MDFGEGFAGLLHPVEDVSNPAWDERCLIQDRLWDNVMFIRISHNLKICGKCDFHNLNHKYHILFKETSHSIKTKQCHLYNSICYHWASSNYQPNIWWRRVKLRASKHSQTIGLTLDGGVLNPMSQAIEGS